MMGGSKKFQKSLTPKTPKMVMMPVGAIESRLAELKKVNKKHVPAISRDAFQQFRLSLSVDADALLSAEAPAAKRPRTT